MLGAGAGVEMMRFLCGAKAVLKLDRGGGWKYSTDTQSIAEGVVYFKGVNLTMCKGAPIKLLNKSCTRSIQARSVSA